jgi:hypothetical protein
VRRNSVVKYIRFTLPALVLATLGAMTTMASSCASQPPVKCTASANPGAARFAVVTSNGCMGVPLVDNKGEVVGVQTFVPSVSDPNAYNLPNSVALQSEEASILAANGQAVMPPVEDTDKTHHLYALGKFDNAFPDGNDICTISTMSKAELNMPVVPAHLDDMMMMVPEQPATHITYQWSNVRIIVRPDSIGTQTFADLAYTRDGCTATFKVSILTPEVSCDNNGMPDQSKCDAPTDPAIGAVPPGTTTCEDQGGQLLCLPNRMQP